MVKPIIFIDIDGPLLPDKSWLNQSNTDVLKSAGGDIIEIIRDFNLKKKIKFDPTAVWMINTLAKYADAEAVLSTNWMNHTSLREMKQLFKANKLNIKIHKSNPITPKKMSSSRMHEIAWWLGNNPDVTDYVILDDDHSVEPNYLKSISAPDSGCPFALMADNVVFVNYQYGMVKNDFKKACSILGLNYTEICQKEFRAEV